MPEPEQIPAAVVAMSLQSLAGNTGWRVFCNRCDDIVRNEIDAKIFDVKTSDEDRRAYVLARSIITGSYTPEKIRQSLITVAEAEIARSKR